MAQSSHPGGVCVVRSGLARSLGRCRGAFLLGTAAAVLLPSTAAASTTVGFEDFAPGTVLTNQYAGAGGPGQGVVFGPLPGGADSRERPVIATAAAQAHSGSQVARIDCQSCGEGTGFVPDTTGTLATARSQISVYAGDLGAPVMFCVAQHPSAGCANVTLTAYGSDGTRVGTPAAAEVMQGQPFALLSVTTSSPQIVGFEIKASVNDVGKQIAIDDLTLETPSSSSPPDFTLTPETTSLTLTAGHSASDVITIGRVNGSSGSVHLAAGTLPPGVHAQLAPDPANSQSMLTLTADRTAPPTPAIDVTITGTPQSESAGTVAHTVKVGVRVTSICADVLVAQDLVDALRSGCQDIHVNDAAHIDLTQVGAHPEQFPGYDAVNTSTGVIHIPDGVTFESDRSASRRGGLLYMSSEVEQPNSSHPKSMLEPGDHTRVSGLRLKGYGADQQAASPGLGVSILSPHVLVNNNEISFWPVGGVGVGPVAYVARPSGDPEAWIFRQAPQIHITNNFIHDNVDCMLGYGIVVGGDSYALIDRNVFDYNKHDVAGDGTRRSGYIAKLNFSLTDSFKACGKSYGGHYDMHGTGGGSEHVGGDAGRYIEVRANAIRGDQRYQFLGRNRRPAFDLRGTPTDKAIFSGNVTEAPLDKALAISGADGSGLVRRGKLLVHGNKFSVNTSGELATGDFDGDGCSDVFLATGVTWVYSPCGRREWRFLNVSGLRLDRLGFGDFNGDGKTDVFSRQGAGKWFVSYGGTGPWTALPADSSIPSRTYRFGDFDGDGKTDVFRANGSRFYISSAGATAWRPLAASHIKVDQLRLCDFNGDGKTDAFSFANHQWSVSYGAVTQWRHLNRQLSSNLGELVFADFNGDGRCDVAREHHNSWQVSWGGTAPWHYESPNRNPGDFSGTLLGRFSGQRCADVLRFGVRNDAVHLERYAISRCLTPFTVWSQQNML